MKVLVVFGSLLGKTRRISVLIGMQLKESGIDVKVKDVRETEIAELNDFDLIILACSTWDDGQLQFDFREFNNSLMKANFSNKNFAIVATGGQKYPHYCLAADVLEKTVSEIKGSLFVPTLRLDIDHDEQMEKCDEEVKEWSNKLMNTIQN